MKLKDLMTRTPVGINAESTLPEAARRMAELDTGFLPVDEDGRAVGVITDRDIVVRAVAQGRNPEDTPVRDIMSPAVCTAFENDDATDAGRIMMEHQIRRLLVLNDHNEVCGVVSMADLARREDPAMTGCVLEEISKPVAASA